MDEIKGSTIAPNSAEESFVATCGVIHSCCPIYHLRHDPSDDYYYYR